MDEAGEIRNPLNLDFRKFDLLVKEKLATRMNGEVDYLKSKHTVLPIPSDVLKSKEQDEAGMDFSFVQDIVSSYSTLIEYSYLHQYAPLGVYCVPDNEDILEWHGIIFVRQGLYRGGVFKFIVKMDDVHPRMAPEVFFITNLYHPLVNPATGKLDIKPCFPEWTDTDYAPLVIVYVKSIFYETDYLFGTTNEGNTEAAETIRKDKKEFMKKVEECVKDSTDSVLDPIEGFAINPFDDEDLTTKICREIKAIAHSAEVESPTDEFIDRLLQALSDSNPPL